MNKQSKRSRAQAKRRPLELYIISAQQLKKVTTFGKMKTYAVAYVDPSEKVSTRIDAEGGKNPTWDEKITLSVDEDLLEDETAQLTIEIFACGTLRDKLIGVVRVFLADAVKTSGRTINKFPVTSLLIFRPQGDPQGILNICIPPSGIFPQRLDSLSFKSTDSHNATALSLEKDQSLRRHSVPSPKLQDSGRSIDSLSIDSFTSDSEDEEDTALRVKPSPPPSVPEKKARL